MQDYNTVENSLDSFFQEDVDVSLNSINDMHIILNDSDCSNTFFDEVCSYLSNQGLEFDITRHSVNIDEDDYTVITLDQQYNSGAGVFIFSPYNNTRLGFSDSLALAFKASLEQKNILTDGILSGRVGFREEEDGHISTMVPTEAEEKIESDKSTSFVTISLGTQNISPEVMGQCVIDALMRQKYYLDHFDSQTDLLYRADAGEDVSIVANYFGSSVDELSEVNHLKDSHTLEAQTIINPDVCNIPSFNSFTVFQMSDQISKTY